ncbi:MAG: ComF family protein [Anaerovoracaceae bacterium]|jgi:competence protein ComFC
MDIKKWICKIGKGLLELIYPSGIYCISCKMPMDNRFPYSLCYNCIRLLQWEKRDICGDEHKFLKGFSCVKYGERERNIIHDFKYGRNPYYGEKLAELMAERLDWGALIKCDLVAPVPMYLEKEKDRGYNQADLLGSHLAGYLQKTYIKNILVRKVNTPPMSHLSPEERRSNVKNVFEVDEKKKHRVYGKNILLVDDVFTTGSTVDECSKVLMEAGATGVFVVTFSSVHRNCGLG